MNRRTRERIDLRLLCRIGPEKVLSSATANQSQVVGMTQNLSRCGLLMRWVDTKWSYPPSVHLLLLTSTFPPTLHSGPV